MYEEKIADMKIEFEECQSLDEILTVLEKHLDNISELIQDGHDIQKYTEELRKNFKKNKERINSK